MALSTSVTVSDVHAGSLPSALSKLLDQGALRAQSADSAQSSSPVPPNGNEQTEGDVPFSELNEALSAARARLAELTKAAEIAKVAGALREDLEATEAENARLNSALSQAQSKLADLGALQQATTLRAEESEKAANDAVAEARRLDEELVATRWQNSQLSTSLANAETSSRSLAEELETVRADLGARVKSLTATADESAGEITALSKEVDATRESALIAEQRGAELEQQLARRSLEADEAKAEAASLTADLDRTITELSNVRAELSSTNEAFDEATVSLSAANQETVVLREQVAGSREEVVQLQTQLDATRVQIDQMTVKNGDLQQQVGVLRTAAGEATDAARLNLLAVENQINEINAALASVKGNEPVAPSGGPTVAIDGQEKDEGVGNVASIEIAGTANNGWVPTLTPARPEESGKPQLAAATTSSSDEPSGASNPLTNQIIPTNGVDEALSTDAVSSEDTTLLATLTDVGRERAETLIVDLNVKKESRGLTMTVPGTILFAVNSETIEPAAYDTLGKVAEMISLYQDRSVVIVGHTDAVGDDGYNQELSERRAALVRNYFVDELGVATNRMSSEGQGETRPIKSNATAEGRDANRRVEVVILN